MQIRALPLTNQSQDILILGFDKEIKISKKTDIMNVFKKLDYFVKPKEEVDNATGVGGLLSIISILVKMQSIEIFSTNSLVEKFS